MAEQPGQQNVDLSRLVANIGPLDLSVSLMETPEDANHRRWKDRIVFCLGLAALTLIFLAALGILVFGSQSADEKKIWAGVLTSLVSGLIGYTLGKK